MATVGIDAAEARQAVTTSVEVPPARLPQLPDPRLWDRAAENSPWTLGLAEALGRALEHSTIIRTAPPGVAAAYTSALSTATTTSLDSSIAATEIQAELGRFDVRVEGSLLGEEEENPPQTSLDGVVRRAGELDKTRFYTGVAKSLPSGGEVAAGVDAGYRYTPPWAGRSLLNPQYQPGLGVVLRQPLLRGRGAEVNLTPVIIAAAKTEQTAWEFQEEVLALLRSVESAYWSLYEAQASVEAIDQVLPLLEEAVRLAEAQVRADVAIPASRAQARSDLLDFRRQRTAALTAVRHYESVLRNLMGLGPDTSRRIVLEDPSVPSEPHLNWDLVVESAMTSRPDIIRQRLTVYIAQQAIEVARNDTLATVDALAAWRAKGLGDDLDEAIDVLQDFHYNDWSLGVVLEYPLGNRTATSRLRAAELVLQRERARLDAFMLAASHEVSDLVYDLHSYYQQYDVAAQRRGEILTWLQGTRARYMHPTADTSLAQTLDLYLRAIRAAAESQVETTSLLVRYYKATARLHEATGVQLASYNLHLHDDPRERAYHLLGPRRLPPVESLPKPVPSESH